MWLSSYENVMSYCHVQDVGMDASPLDEITFGIGNDILHMRSKANGKDLGNIMNKVIWPIVGEPRL